MNSVTNQHNRPILHRRRFAIYFEIGTTYAQVAVGIFDSSAEAGEAMDQMLREGIADKLFIAEVTETTVITSSKTVLD